jgi:transcriptional regulator
MSTKEQQQLMEWRRDKVIILSSRGFTQSEIARELQVDRSLISRDMTYIRQQAQEHLKTHIQERMPEEYHKVEVSITQVLKKAWDIVDNTTDERIRLQALALIRECDNTKMEMISHATIITDALKFIESKTEKLVRDTNSSTTSPKQSEEISEEITTDIEAESETETDTDIDIDIETEGVF